MDYNELTQLWKNPDQDIERSAAVNRQLLKEVSTGKIRSRLAGFRWSELAGVVLNYLFATFLLDFAIAHYGEWKYFLPALLLLLVTLTGLIFNTIKLVLYLRIHSGHSVLRTQRDLERIQYLNAVDTNLLYVVIPLFSTTFIIVMAKSIAGFDVFVFRTFLIGNTAISFIVAGILVYFLKKYPNKKLQESIDFLKEIRDADK